MVPVKARLLSEVVLGALLVFGAENSVLEEMEGGGGMDGSSEALMGERALEDWSRSTSPRRNTAVGRCVSI